MSLSLRQKLLSSAIIGASLGEKFVSEITCGISKRFGKTMDGNGINDWTLSWNATSPLECVDFIVSWPLHNSNQENHNVIEFGVHVD